MAWSVFRLVVKITATLVVAVVVIYLTTIVFYGGQESFSEGSPGVGFVEFPTLAPTSTFPPPNPESTYSQHSQETMDRMNGLPIPTFGPQRPD